MGVEISNANFTDGLKFLNNNSLAFKARGEDKSLSKTEIDVYRHRGMPTIIPGVYASARDFGNIGAGIVAGETGVSLEVTCFVFDIVNKGKEPAISQLAQDLGWSIGNARVLNKLRGVE